MSEEQVEGIPLLTVDSTGSTNTDLLENPAYQAFKACALRARRQTAGRGRQGRSWLPSEDALTFSIRWTFTRPAHQLSGLALAVSLGVLQSLESQGYADLKIKWPNDLYHGEKKLGGILVELGKPGAETPVVIGIGINLHAPKLVLDQPTTGLLAFGPTQSPESLFPKLVADLKETLMAFDDAGFEAFQSAWLTKALWLNRGVRCGTLQGRFVGVDPSGAAIVMTALGENKLFSGDVSLIPEDKST